MTKILNDGFFEKNGFLFVCRSEKTRYGFRHVCDVAQKEGMRFFASFKRCYYNRTWERFTFESVLNDACRSLKIPVFESENG